MDGGITMNKQTLDKLRFLIPGIIISVNVYFVLYGIIGLQNDPLKNYLFYLLSLFTSVFYYSFNLRDFIWRKIEDKTILQYIALYFKSKKDNKEVPKACIHCLKGTEKFDGKFIGFCRKELFRNIDDGNPKSLKEKSGAIMLNGCILTSVIDLFIITAAVFVFEIIAFIIEWKFDSIVFWISLSILVISPIIIYKLTSKHMELTKSQLNVINWDAIKWEEHDK